MAADLIFFRMHINWPLSPRFRVKIILNFHSHFVVIRAARANKSDDSFNLFRVSPSECMTFGTQNGEGVGLKISTSSLC